MGTFDDPNKSLSKSATELAPAKPKPRPQPLITSGPMRFNGVVGRQSLPIPTKLTNPNDQTVVFELEVGGAEFQATQSTGQVDARQTGDNVTDVHVRYTPTKPGVTHALLHLLSTFEGERDRDHAVAQVIELEGTATALFHQEPAPADGSPRPIPDLAHEPIAASPRAQVNRDLDVLSGLAETYTRIVGANDVAAAEMIGRIHATKNAFASQIEQWVQGELAAHKMSEASTVGKLAWKALGKVVGAGIEKLEMGNVVTAVVGFVAETALDRIQEDLSKDRNAATKRAAGQSAQDGGAALIQSTELHVKIRLQTLAQRLFETRERAGFLAGRLAMDRERFAQEAPPSKESYDHLGTVVLVDEFREAAERYSDACRAIAATATQLEPNLVASFNRVRMQYLKVRAAKSEDQSYRVDYAAAWDLGSEASHNRETLHVFDPKVSGLHALSPAMRDFVIHRKLSDYADDAVVTVRVNCAQGGYVIIEKRVGKEPVFKDVSGIGAVRAAMRGAQGFWNFLEENIGC